jgi:exosortase D (VPLPA-CTERM-specific)
MQTDAGVRYRMPPLAWVLLAAASAALALAGTRALAGAWDTWLELPEYSHGVIVPVVCLFLVWQRQHDFVSLPMPGSWFGTALAAAGVALHAAGKLAALLIMQQYGLLVMLYGLLWSMLGGAAMRRLAVPLLLLGLAIPLPQFVLKPFSAHMQLVSSQIGVWFIRLFDVSVFLEGNVIDLGSLKLQVAEACDGLRYLFPLMTLGLIMACFYRAPMWQRALVFISSVPITILMNSLRIGVIGITVEHWGKAMAEGFLHEFQGWVVFMASATLMVLEMALLARLGPLPRRLGDVFRIEFPAPLPAAVIRVPRPVARAFVASTVLLVAYGIAAAALPERAETVPERASLAAFPLRAGDWIGQPEAMDRIYLDALKLDDYVIANFARSPFEPRVNLYVAWYDSQRAGQSAHSPRTCIPGGGWSIAALAEHDVPGVSMGSVPLRVNRALIVHGSERQLVYYWFQQRGRVVTDEYAVKWYILVDALRRNRTDGAMVRVLTPLQSGEDEASADTRLQQFLVAAAPRLPTYVPD